MYSELTSPPGRMRKHEQGGGAPIAIGGAKWLADHGILVVTPYLIADMLKISLTLSTGLYRSERTDGLPAKPRPAGR